MIYLDFIKNKDENYTTLISKIREDEIISIPPKIRIKKTSHLKIYSGYNKVDYELLLNKIWENIQKWIRLNLPEFGEKSIKLCSYHLASHFTQNYLSTFNIISNLIKSKNCEYTIICSNEMLTIDPDWCSSLVSLIATVEALDLANIKYYILETSPGVAKTLISEASLNYTPASLESICPDASHVIFKEKLIDCQYISYQLTYRFNPYFSLRENINIIPKSNINQNNLIGAYYQFSKNKLQAFKYTPWGFYKTTSHPFANRIERNFFNSFGIYLFPKLKQSYFNLEYLLNSKSKKTLILEEIVDLEALPLVSIFEKTSNCIAITQHSSNPNLTPLFVQNEKSLASKVFVNNQYSFDFYKEHLPFIDIIMSPAANAPAIPNKNFIYKKTIIIIENDFFRSFGVFSDIHKIYCEISLFINKLIEIKCDFNILWRQRTNDYSPLYEMLKNDYSSIIFQFDSKLSIDELANISNISIGFGSNSSLAAQLIKRGVINYFGSFSYSEFEYVPKITSYHEFIGPEISAIHIGHLIKNTENSFTNALIKQNEIIDAI